MEFHEYAGIFPLMHGREFDELCADIKANGQREPIWVIAAPCPEPGDHKCYGIPGECDLEAGDGVWTCRACDYNPAPFEDLILDGRNRYRACKALGIDPWVERYDGDDPLAFVISLNLHRRHLSEGQRAMVAANIANMRQGARTDLEPSANLPEVSQTKAAEMLNVSERTVRAAVKVRDTAAPELIAAVESGKVSVSAAADVATLPKEEQTVIVARGEKEILEAAKAIRTEKAVAKRVENEKLKAETRAIELPAGKYRTIVIDPPWDMKKIPRTVDTLHHEELDYPTMTLEEIAAFPVADMAHDEAIIYCWTTQKYLPNTFDILAAWGFRYLVTMVWHKPGGFQPFGLPQYNCEFVLIGRKDGCAFDDTKAFMLCNQWPRREHSRKPDEFYDLVRRVSPGPRIDVFSREERDGFDQFGNQTEKFGGAA